MSIRTTAIMLLISLLIVHTFTHAQNNSELSTLNDAIISYIQSQKADWKYENVQPITGSAAVVLQQWTLDSQSVRIAIISHKSTQDAATAISKLAREGQLIERVQALGDEGISWGRGVVSFRNRNLTIDVSAANIDSTRNPTELSNKGMDEHKIAREFALLVADAIKRK